MLAVLVLDQSLVATLAADCGLAIVIHNAPRHYVIAGPRAGIDAVVPRLETAGAARLVHLAVQTPSTRRRRAVAAPPSMPWPDKSARHSTGRPVCKQCSRFSPMWCSKSVPAMRWPGFLPSWRRTCRCVPATTSVATRGF